MEASEEWSSTRSWKDGICPLQGCGNRMGGGPLSFAPNPQDDDVQNNPEHDESKERYKAFREKHRLDPEEKKPIVQVCQHGYKRQRGHWSIELFESKRGAIDLTATRSKRKELESQSYRVLAVQFSTEALVEALTQCEAETPKFKTRFVRGHNTDIDLDKQTWHWNGDTLPFSNVTITSFLKCQHGVKASPCRSESMQRQDGVNKQCGQLRAAKK